MLLKCEKEILRENKLVPIASLPEASLSFRENLRPTFGKSSLKETVQRPSGLNPLILGSG